jgi:uncharacterized protein
VPLHDRDRFPVDPATQKWGLGDVGVGILASTALATVVGGLIIAVAGWAGDDPIPIWGLAVLQLPLWAGYLGVTVFATVGKGGGFVRDLGLRSTFADAPVGLLIGVLTQLVLLPLLYLPILELTGRSTEDLSAPARELAERAGDLPEWVLFALIVGIGAPVVEELFYRGLFLRALRKRSMGAAVAVVVTSLVFALVHFQLLQFPGLAAFGLVAGALTVRTGRLGPAIWAHVGFNLTTVVVLYHGL